MVPRGASLSDLCRELLSEAVLARLRADERRETAGRTALVAPAGFVASI